MSKSKLHAGVALIEVRDPLMLTEIENDPVLRPFLGERVSDVCVAVQPQAVPEVMERLQALGHMPRLQDDADDTLEASAS
jgi:hypothetical protein